MSDRTNLDSDQYCESADCDTQQQQQQRVYVKRWTLVNRPVTRGLVSAIECS